MILAQLDGAEGMVLERPHPCRPRPASSAMAEALPSLSISRRVSLCIGPRLFDAIAVTKVVRVPSARFICLGRHLQASAFLWSAILPASRYREPESPLGQ